MHKYVILVSAFFLLSLSLNGQPKPDCIQNYLVGYTIDGQIHDFELEDSRIGKVLVSFFEGFQYRFAICSKTTKKYKIELYDIEKKLLFSTFSEDYVKQFDFCFNSNAACYIEITVNEISNEPQQFRIGIGYKEADTKKIK